jgi:membrane protease YdiL (CAAX protease family)
VGALLRFFALTFLASWTCFIGARWLGGNAQSALILLGVFCPALVAIGLTLRQGGVDEVAVLLRPLVRWNTGVRWYVFAATFMAAIKLSAAAIHRVLVGVWPRFGSEPLLLMVAAAIFSVVAGGQTGEEIGWRGYALPRLGTRFGYGPAGLLLGLIWAIWHFPIFFLQQGDLRGQSMAVYVLQVIPISVAMTWLYVRSGGSLLLTMLMHAAINNTKDIVPSGVPGATNPFTFAGSAVAWITVALLWTCAAWFLFRLRGVSTLYAPASWRNGWAADSS